MSVALTAISRTLEHAFFKCQEHELTCIIFGCRLLAKPLLLLLLLHLYLQLC